MLWSNICIVCRKEMELAMHMGLMPFLSICIHLISFFFNNYLHPLLKYRLWLPYRGLAVGTLVLLVSFGSTGSYRLIFFSRSSYFPFSQLTRNLHLMDKIKWNKASSCIAVMLAHIILISSQDNLKFLFYCSKLSISLFISNQKKCIRRKFCKLTFPEDGLLNN